MHDQYKTSNMICYLVVSFARWSDCIQFYNIRSFFKDQIAKKWLFWLLMIESIKNRAKIYIWTGFSEVSSVIILDCLLTVGNIVEKFLGSGIIFQVHKILQLMKLISSIVFEIQNMIYLLFLMIVFNY